MRYRGYRGYGPYRGRSRGSTALKIVIVLLAVVLLAVVGVYFVVDRFGVYSSDGFRLELPFRTGEASAPPRNSAPVVVVSTDPEPTPSPTPEPEEPLHAVMLPRSALSDGTAAEQVAAAGGNAAVFDMKADDGTLGYVSQLEIAQEGQSTAADSALNGAIRALNASELYTVARVSCFRDNTVPYHVPELGVKTNRNYNWRDNGDYRWLSPTSETARQYVTGVCLELAELGFDEILLCNSGYPVDGYLSSIRVGEAYDAGQFQSVITAFYDQVGQALQAQYPEVRLSIATTGAVLESGSDATSGQSLSGLAARAQRVWADLGETTREQALAALSAAGYADPAAALVVQTDQAGAAGESWALSMP